MFNLIRSIILFFVFGYCCSAQPVDGVALGKHATWEYSPQTGAETAAQENKPILWSLSSFKCDACNELEASAFLDIDISSTLGSFVLIKVYIDGDPILFADAIKIVPTIAEKKAPAIFLTTSLGAILTEDQNLSDLPSMYNELVGISTSAPNDSKAKDSSDFLARAMKLSDTGISEIYFDDRWTILSFWGSWCAPCIEELDQFLAADAREFEWLGGRFISIALETEDSLAQAKSMAKKYNLSPENSYYLLNEHQSNQVAQRLGWDHNVVPYIVVLNLDGEVVEAKFGEFNHSLIAPYLEQLKN